MAVEINIDLDSSKADTKIETLRTHLKSLNDDLNLDFDIDDDLKDKIDKLTDELKEIDVDVDYDDLEKAAALKAMLQGDIDADLNVDTDKALADIRDSLDPPDTSGVDHDEQARKFASQSGDSEQFKRFMSRFEKFGTQPRKGDGSFGFKDFSRRFLDKQRSGEFSRVSVQLGDLDEKLRFGDSDPDRLGRIKEIMSDRAAFGDRPTRGYYRSGPEVDYNSVGDRFGTGDYDSNRLGRVKDSLSRWSENGAYRVSTDGFDATSAPSIGDDGPKVLNANKRGSLIGRFKKKLKSLVPSMSTFYTIFAAVLPLMVALGTQLAGVAASMGAVGVAGGSILALGLVGHGEDMASSWQKAQEQLATLKQEMFETFQPTMQTFAPIQARFFDSMPGELDKVATAMEGLTVYSDTLFASFSGITDFIARFFDVIVANEGIISQLAMRFGAIIGSSILDFFQFLVTEAYNSQEMLIKLGGAFADLLSGAYQFSKIIARLAMAFRPLAGLFEWLGKFLNNKLIIGVLTFVAALGATIWAVTTLVGVTTALASVWAGGLVATIIASTKLLAGYIFRTLAAVTANYALAASIANVVAFATMGIGALLGMAAAASAVNGMNAEMGVDTSGLGGGIGGGAGGFGGGAGGGTTQKVVNEGDTYNMEVNGDVDNPTEQGLRDIVSSETGVSTTRGYPGPGGA